jgi:hypothetical protein
MIFTVLVLFSWLHSGPLPTRMFEPRSWSASCWLLSLVFGPEMEAVRHYETSVNLCWPKCCYSPEGRTLCNHRCDYLKFKTLREVPILATLAAFYKLKEANVTVCLGKC